MRREYDFSTAVRGKFYRKGAVLNLPIYLDAKVQAQVERIARKQGREIGTVVNQLVKKEVDLLEALIGSAGRR
jgi:cytidylate kinase